MKKFAPEYTILIVDDIPTNVMLVQSILKKEEYTLITAENGVKALEQVKKNKPNLILLDIMMPEMDGYEVLEKLMSNPETNDIQIIIMSALNDMPSIIKAYQLGAIDYVTKPFQREELVKRIEHRYDLFRIEHMRRELESTIESRDMLYSAIAHDLRVPLGSLKMMTYSLLQIIDKKTINPEAYDMLLTMNKTTEETNLLLDNLSKWSKYNLNPNSQPHKQKIDINSIIENITVIYKPIGELKQIKISFPDFEKKLMCDVDIDMVKTIIRNLLSNALKYSNDGGTISISTHVENEHIIFSIKDSGNGIKKEDQDKILNPEVHFSTFGTNDERGSGLGLNICKAFAELHGGSVWFKSEKGKGSTFFFSIKTNTLGE